METVSILDIPFFCVSLEQSVQYAIAQIEAKQKGYVVTPNAEIAYQCQHDEKLMHIVQGASLVLPDGVGITHASKLLKTTPRLQKVAGIEFAQALVQKMEEKGYTLYLLGGKPGIAEQAAHALQAQYPRLQIVGVQDGYFKTNAQVQEALTKAGGADVVFVCLGAPKQEYFMAEMLDVLPATLLCGLGGTLDVFSGTVKRAPKIFIQLGLEWFYRLITDPKRIGRMMSLPKFMWLVLKKKWTK